MPAKQTINLTPGAGTVSSTDTTGVVIGPPAGMPALPIICESASNPLGWTRRVGLSVSEPLFSAPNYYPFPDAISR
jgi:hypothetical protein